MNRLTSDETKQLSQTVSKQPTRGSSNENGDDDDIFIKTDTNDDQQAHIRRRAPTRHSIKSLTGRKTLTRQTSTNEVGRFFFFPFLFVLYFHIFHHVFDYVKT